MTRTVFEKADVIPLVAEVFRELGFEGASMNRIVQRTKLSKGSLYHFFPGGKDEMAAEILAYVHDWFAAKVFDPLEKKEPRAAIRFMWQAVDDYFRSGRRSALSARLRSMRRATVSPGRSAPTSSAGSPLWHLR